MSRGAGRGQYGAKHTGIPVRSRWITSAGRRVVEILKQNALEHIVMTRMADRTLPTLLPVLDKRMLDSSHTITQIHSADEGKGK